MLIRTLHHPLGASYSVLRTHYTLVFDRPKCRHISLNWATLASNPRTSSINFEDTAYLLVVKYGAGAGDGKQKVLRKQGDTVHLSGDKDPGRPRKRMPLPFFPLLYMYCAHVLCSSALFLESCHSTLALMRILQVTQ
ncbi:hypothetical protein CCMA1212_001744 [Trichoderma ghanense]|uniref:Uncharacterized protein n=1 Tax=Trichoderma ghanense TaxID=65468 RepID=A0ABY2HBW2_9HYPO